MKRFLFLLLAVGTMPAAALAQPSTAQFVPPNGLPMNTPLGTARNADGSGVVTFATLQAGISSAVTSDQMQSALADYLTTSAAASTYTTPAAVSAAVQTEANRAAAAEAANAGNIAALQSGTLSKAEAATSYLSLSGGSLTGSVTTSGDPMKAGFVVLDPQQSGMFTGLWYDANKGEFTIENNTGSNNALAIKTTNANGFAAIAFDGPDMTYGGNFEHGAVGWGPRVAYGPDVGVDYFEISRFTYDGTFNRQPVPFMWQTTGTELVPWGMTTAYGIVTKGSATITCVGGCTFPGDTGQILDTPAEYGLFPAGTTIVSGAGTKTMTLSKAALASSASATAGTYFRFGNAEGSQHDFLVYTPMGNADYYRFSDAKWGNFTNAPYFSIDRVNGRLGVLNPLPATPLDVSGAILSNISGATSLNAYSGNGALNAQVTPGVAGQKNILHAYAVNTNQFNLNWEANPQRITMQDVNAGANIFEFRMDGSWQSQQYAHPVDTITADTTLSNTAHCGRTLAVNSSSAVTITVANWTLVGCRITVTQAGTGAVTLAPAAGLTLGSYVTQAQTGPYTLPGQYASVVIEAKAPNLATVERGQ
ncbi:hypothetical protein C0V97_01175 [Asaia sp. W19]|uniref:hypothetical protein n=1 Tax=unclassified Asaia TaxID=2685023 RepID=UPI000F8F73F0|nr:hypothetical protein [Asaia sp. W19]RUT27411.1 hypothetical protein C0V97_01175 [Asaia sp. W19]